jgi:2C-methyl-D-erythritol 2,4-cyclodiphosphate synthase
MATSGSTFPEDDPDAEDARSLEFVEQFAAYVRAAGYEIANVDTFVVLGPDQASTVHRVDAIKSGRGSRG